jgi:hypothetical protein
MTGENTQGKNPIFNPFFKKVNSFGDDGKETWEKVEKSQSFFSEGQFVQPTML